MVGDTQPLKVRIRAPSAMLPIYLNSSSPAILIRVVLATRLSIRRSFVPVRGTLHALSLQTSHFAPHSSCHLPAELLVDSDSAPEHGADSGSRMIEDTEMFPNRSHHGSNQGQCRRSRKNACSPSRSTR
jgi:hypothetical protein